MTSVVSENTASFKTFFGLGPVYQASAEQVRSALMMERCYGAAWLLAVLAMSAWLAPYWGFRVFLVGGGFFLALTAGLVSPMRALGSAPEDLAPGEQRRAAASGGWGRLAYGGIIFSLIAAVWNPALTRERVLHWRYNQYQPGELASLRFDFEQIPARFNEPEAKRLFPGQPIRCMQFFEDEPQYQFGTHECYFWMRDYNDKPAYMSDFVFGKDRLNAVRLEVPFWQQGAHRRALIERYGLPQARVLSPSLTQALVQALLRGVPLPEPEKMNLWVLPSGILLTEAELPWREPSSLILWIGKPWLCEREAAAKAPSAEMRAYCASSELPDGGRMI